MGTYTAILTVIDENGDSDEATVSVDVTDGEGPVTSNILADPNPVAVNGLLAITANADDTYTGGSNIAAAEYSLDGGTTWFEMGAMDEVFDGVSEDVIAVLNVPSQTGVYDLCVRSTDAADNIGAEECTMLVVYDPTGGFVTGGGWIDSPPGAYKYDLSLTGKATFGFVSKYKKGANVPTGNTEFQFKAGNLNFHSSSYDWLVVSGKDKAKFKGTGTIDDYGEYKFMLWAGDGGRDDVDTFRIKIWEEGSEEDPVYDNGLGADDDIQSGRQPIDGGSIVIHTK